MPDFTFYSAYRRDVTPNTLRIAEAQAQVPPRGTVSKVTIKRERSAIRKARRAARHARRTSR